MSSNEIVAVLRQALEALEYPLNTRHEVFDVDMAELLAHRAITSLRTAIASYSQAIATAVAEPHKESSATQEPVVGYYFPLTNDTMRGSIEALIAHAKRARWTNAVVRKDGVETTYEADWIKCLVPYTYPQPKAEQEPKRESARSAWVGLTDEEIRKLCVTTYGGYEFCRLVEAKLKEKNQ